MKKEIGVLFALIRCAVLGQELDDETKKIACQSSDIIYEMAKHHDLAHLLEYAFKMSGIAVEDDGMAYKYLKQNAISVMRYENLNLALENISKLLESEKIPFIPLKGAVMRKFYPEPWMRTSCDLDILVHEEDVERAEKAIVEKLGYISSGERDYHDISLFSDTDVHLELHFSIKENMKNIDGILSKVWEYASPSGFGAYKHVLSNEFFMFQIAAHLSYHVFGGGCSIRNFIDLFLLERDLEFDRNKFYSMLEECKIKKFYDESLKLTNVWFLGAEHDETTLLFQKYLLDGGVYGTRMNQLAYKRSKQSFFSYVFERIFMPYEQLLVRYPELEGKRHLVPLYQLKRWWRIVSKGRIGYSKKEISSSSGVATEDMENVANLFEKLGLDIL